MVHKQSVPKDNRLGLAHWMQQVLEELNKASTELAPGAVHDLRVAIRRCRSMAEGFQSVDPDKTWGRMRKTGKAVFRVLGELRDAQVMLEWVERLGDAEDPATGALLDLSRAREQTLKADAAKALQDFDSKPWRSWIEALESRATRVPLGSLLFQYLATERWEQAHALHRRALRNRSKIAFHELRIGLKKLRYIVENFLPAHHRQWGNDLKELQDILGEVHDLDVLWSTALRGGVFTIEQSRLRWRARIGEERKRRIDKYRERMVGKGSLWPLWRAALPSGEQLENAVLIKLETWASYLDPEPQHAQRVAKLALQLYGGMIANEQWSPDTGRPRDLLKAAALMHEIGRVKTGKNHHKASARLIRKLETPLGWSPEDLQTTALIARYHRGALPRVEQKYFARLPRERQRVARLLGGVLRLADALDDREDRTIAKLRVERTAIVRLLRDLPRPGTCLRARSAFRY
jgi:CHAD domain-containing protein